MPIRLNYDKELAVEVTAPDQNGRSGINLKLENAYLSFAGDEHAPPVLRLSFDDADADEKADQPDPPPALDWRQFRLHLSAAIANAMVKDDIPNVGFVSFTVQNMRRPSYVHAGVHIEVRFHIRNIPGADGVALAWRSLPVSHSRFDAALGDRAEQDALVHNFVDELMALVAGHAEAVLSGE